MALGTIAGRLTWMVLAAALVAGCATLAPATPEAAVQQRAQARWNALLAGEWGQAYRYMAPSYRALVPEKRYANQFGGGVVWVAAEVVQVTCAAERCLARMKVTFRAPMGMRAGDTAATHFDETWIREEGQWWLFQNV